MSPGASRTRRAVGHHRARCAAARARARLFNKIFVARRRPTCPSRPADRGRACSRATRALRRTATAACRPRTSSASTTTWRGIAELERKLSTVAARLAATCRARRADQTRTASHRPRPCGGRQVRPALQRRGRGRVRVRDEPHRRAGLRLHARASSGYSGDWHHEVAHKWQNASRNHLVKLVPGLLRAARSSTSRPSSTSKRRPASPTSTTRSWSGRRSRAWRPTARCRSRSSPSAAPPASSRPGRAHRLPPLRQQGLRARPEGRRHAVPGLALQPVALDRDAARWAFRRGVRGAGVTRATACRSWRTGGTPPYHKHYVEHVLALFRDGERRAALARGLTASGHRTRAC